MGSWAQVPSSLCIVLIWRPEAELAHGWIARCWGAHRSVSCRSLKVETEPHPLTWQMPMSHWMASGRQHGACGRFLEGAWPGSYRKSVGGISPGGPAGTHGLPKASHAGTCTGLTNKDQRKHGVHDSLMAAVSLGRKITQK